MKPATQDILRDPVHLLAFGFAFAVTNPVTATADTAVNRASTNAVATVRKWTREELDEIRRTYLAKWKALAAKGAGAVSAMGSYGNTASCTRCALDGQRR